MYYGHHHYFVPFLPLALLEFTCTDCLPFILIPLYFILTFASFRSRFTRACPANYLLKLIKYYHTLSFLITFETIYLWEAHNQTSIVFQTPKFESIKNSWRFRSFHRQHLCLDCSTHFAGEFCHQPAALHYIHTRVSSQPHDYKGYCILQHLLIPFCWRWYQHEENNTVWRSGRA